MDKLNYITRQLARAERKRFENYVVTRIWHLLDDLTLKFITQQYVVRPTGRALTDMFFPQLGIHIEVDQLHHLNTIEQDKLREADIVNATNHRIYRVDTSKGIVSVNEQIDEIIKLVKHSKLNHPSFKPWDLKTEQNPETYIVKGSIDLSDDVAFKNCFLAANCFGHNYVGFQKAVARHPNEAGKIIWFPKLYKNGGWDNSISDNEETITEKSLHNPNHTLKIVNGLPTNRIVFAKVKSPLGDVMYRFKGEYELDTDLTNTESGLIWKRISTTVKTYSSN